MRYIVNESNYITAVAFGCELACQGYECVEYTGSVPTGYTSLEDWYAGEGEQLHRWKVVDGELTQDSTATAPVDKTIFDLIYPVGSIYLSTSPASPEILFGGIWEQIKDVFLLAAGDSYEAGDTGGVATVTLTSKQLPISAWQSVSGSGGVETSTSGAAGAGRGMWTQSTTWGQPHENMPPYLAVYAWRRTT